MITHLTEVDRRSAQAGSSTSFEAKEFNIEMYKRMHDNGHKLRHDMLALESAIRGPRAFAELRLIRKKDQKFVEPVKEEEAMPPVMLACKEAFPAMRLMVDKTFDEARALVRVSDKPGSTATETVKELKSRYQSGYVSGAEELADLKAKLAEELQGAPKQPKGTEPDGTCGSASWCDLDLRCQVLVYVLRDLIT